MITTQWAQPCSFIHLLCMTDFMLQQQSWVVLTEIKRKSVTWRFFVIRLICLPARQHLYQCKISYQLGKATNLQGTCHYVECGCKGNYTHQGWLLWDLEKRMAKKYNYVSTILTFVQGRGILFSWHWYSGHQDSVSPCGEGRINQAWP